MTDKSMQILNISITGRNRSRVLRRLLLQRKNLLHLATVNTEFVMQAKDNKKFKEVLDSVEETVADGIGVVWAVKYLTGEVIDRITGVYLVDEILKYANDKGGKVFLLGGKPGVAEKASVAMKKKWPRLKISWYEGATNASREKRAEAGMTLAKINSFEPDYLLVAYGSPVQDIWIEENRKYLRAKVAIGVGGVLDEWAGVVKRCPDWIDKAGFKWLWRLLHEPWRWKRQTRLIKFILLVLREKLKR